MKHWHCGTIGNQSNMFNLDWDLSGWTFGLGIWWDVYMVEVRFLCFALIYWKCKCRQEVGRLQEGE